MSRTYREDRVPYTGDTRRLFLDPLKIDGAPITSLEPGDSITWHLYHETGVQISTGSPTYDVVFTDDNGVGIRAWTMLITFPDTLPTGKTKEKLTLKWTVTVSGSVLKLYDVIELQKTPV